MKPNVTPYRYGAQAERTGPVIHDAAHSSTCSPTGVTMARHATLHSLALSPAVRSTIEDVRFM
jgi:hypothetical protein